MVIVHVFVLLGKMLLYGLIGVIFWLCGYNANRNLPQAAAPQYFSDRILVQIEPATVTDKVDPAIVKKLNTYLYNKFSSSASFVVLTGSKEDLAGTQKKLLRITPVLTYHQIPGVRGNIYYCQTSISCRLLDFETGVRSNNVADDIQISKNCPNPIIVPLVNGQESFKLTSEDVDTMFNETFPLVWQELERKIMEKFQVNTKNAKERK